MAESEIPDIRKAAVQAVHGLDGRGMIGIDRQFLADRVYRAIANERERCRLIAAGFDDGGDSGFSQAARTIERIVRQDSPNAPTT